MTGMHWRRILGFVALAIVGNRIVALGDDAAVAPWQGPKTVIEDLRGAFVTPGFNDGHVHVDSTGALLKAEVQLTLGDGREVYRASAGAR